MADTVDQTAAVPSSVFSQLRAAEKHWIWKAGIRTLICVLNIIAIGCAAHILSTRQSVESISYSHYFEYPGTMAGALIVLCVSFVWCLICVVLPMRLKPPHPLHPGIAVGFDLILWLAFLVVGLFTLVSVYSVVQFGSDPTYLPDPSYGGSDYSGSYYLAPNNTWVYNITSTATNYDTRYYNYTTGEYEYNQTDISTVVRECDPFTSCAMLDAAVNSAWRSKLDREALIIIVDAVEFLGVLFHFTLFVWACVDTHRHNRDKVTAKESVVADRIIADLERRGLITVQNGVVMQAPVAQNAPLNQAPQMTQTYHSAASFYAPEQSQIEGSRPTGPRTNDSIAVAR